MPNEHKTLTELFTGIANAIRAKTGAADKLVADTFPDAIAAISTGTDTSDATAVAGDILAGKTAYGATGKLTGTIPERSDTDLTASGATVSVPAGHYASAVSKNVASVTGATPSISVNTAGLITASVTQGAGYVAAGTKTATQQLATQGAQTITPGTSNRTISSGRYLTGTQTIKGDANLVSANIVSGKSIFGVSGSAPAMAAMSTVNFNVVSGNCLVCGSVKQQPCRAGDSRSAEIGRIGEHITICHPSGTSMSNITGMVKTSGAATYSFNSVLMQPYTITAASCGFTIS